MDLFYIGSFNVKYSDKSVFENPPIHSIQKQLSQGNGGDTNDDEECLRDLRFFCSKDPMNSSTALFKNLKLIDLIELNNVPLWLHDSGVCGQTDPMKVYTKNLKTESFFKNLLYYSNFDSFKTSVGVLVETDNTDKFLLMYPKLRVSGALEIESTVLNFDNEINVKLLNLTKLWNENKLHADSEKTIFIEIETEMKKDDNFFDAYLKKRSTSLNTVTGVGNGTTRSQSLKQHSATAANHINGTRQSLSINEQFNKMLEKFILSEYRMRNIYSKLSKESYKELYSLVLKSTRFILRSSLKKNQLPELDTVSNTVTKLIDTFLSDPTSTDSIFTL